MKDILALLSRLAGGGIPGLQDLLVSVFSGLMPSNCFENFSAAGTVKDTTLLIDITSGSSTFTVTIPQAANAKGKIYFANHRTGSGTVTIKDDAETPNTIVNLSTTRAALLYSDGSAWKVNLLPYMSQDVTDIETYLNNHVCANGLGSDGSSASTHADASTYDFNADVSGTIQVVIGGANRTLAAATNFDVAHGATSPIGATNTDIIYAVCVYDNSGTLTLFSVAGTAAPAISVAAPTDAAIAAAHAGGMRLFNFQVHRTGASTITVTVDNTVRPTL